MSADIEDLAEKIQAKVIEINGGTVPTGRGGLSVSYLTGGAKCREDHDGWCASIYINKYSQPLFAHGDTAEAALAALAVKLGA